MPEVVIIRDVRYEYRAEVASTDPLPAFEINDMEVVNDSGDQVFVEGKE